MWFGWWFEGGLDGGLGFGLMLGLGWFEAGLRVVWVVV